MAYFRIRVWPSGHAIILKWALREKIEDQLANSLLAAQPPGVEDVVAGVADLVPGPGAEGRIESERQSSVEVRGVGARIDDDITASTSR